MKTIVKMLILTLITGQFILKLKNQTTVPIIIRNVYIMCCYTYMTINKKCDLLRLTKYT